MPGFRIFELQSVLWPWLQRHTLVLCLRKRFLFSEPGGNVADIFFSYARPDLEVARCVAEDLEAEGFSVFFDQQIGVGESWDALIEEEIEGAKCVVVLWSPVSRSREWVRNEARFGKQKGILRPALIESCALPLEFNGTQTADIQTRKPGDRQHGEWRRLIQSVSELAKPELVSAKPADEIGNVPYWRAFTPIAESHGRVRKAPKEPRSENYNTPLDRQPGFEVYASAYIMRSKTKRYGAYLWLWAQKPESADALMPILEQAKAQIEQVFGESVHLDRMSKHGIWISVNRHGDPDDRLEWPKQHAWMAERMAKLASIYRDFLAPRLPVIQ